jgi:hypothetical protein
MVLIFQCKPEKYSGSARTTKLYFSFRNSAQTTIKKAELDYHKYFIFLKLLRQKN